MTVDAKGIDPEQIVPSPVWPYPGKYERRAVLSDGLEISIRPIRPEDEPELIRFHESLSDRSVYLRYFHWMKLEQRVDHARLAHLCLIDYHQEMALLATVDASTSGPPEIAGIGRLVKSYTADEAELAVIVCDRFQHRGIGAELVRQLLGFARDERIHKITASVLRENTAMQKVFGRLGFELKDIPGDCAVTAEITL